MCAAVCGCGWHVLAGECVCMCVCMRDAVTHDVLLLLNPLFGARRVLLHPRSWSLGIMLWELVDGRWPKWAPLSWYWTSTLHFPQHFSPVREGSERGVSGRAGIGMWGWQERGGRLRMQTG